MRVGHFRLLKKTVQKYIWIIWCGYMWGQHVVLTSHEATSDMLLGTWKRSSEVSFPQILWSGTENWLRGLRGRIFFCLAYVLGITTFNVRILNEFADFDRFSRQNSNFFTIPSKLVSLKTPFSRLISFSNYCGPRRMFSNVKIPPPKKSQCSGHFLEKVMNEPIHNSGVANEFWWFSELLAKNFSVK